MMADETSQLGALKRKAELYADLISTNQANVSVLMVRLKIKHKNYLAKVVKLRTYNSRSEH